MQGVVLGVGKVSCLERCPQFRSVLIERERFHCTVYTHTHTHTHTTKLTHGMYLKLNGT